MKYSVATNTIFIFPNLFTIPQPMQAALAALVLKTHCCIATNFSILIIIFHSHSRHSSTAASSQFPPFPIFSLGYVGALNDIIRSLYMSSAFIKSGCRKSSSNPLLTHTPANHVHQIVLLLLKPEDVQDEVLVRLAQLDLPIRRGPVLVIQPHHYLLRSRVLLLARLEFHCHPEAPPVVAERHLQRTLLMIDEHYSRLLDEPGHVPNEPVRGNVHRQVERGQAGRQRRRLILNLPDHVIGFRVRVAVVHGRQL